MLPTKETDHVGKARTLLIEQFKKRRVITGYLDVLSRRVQDIENVLWDVIDKRLLVNAADAQLDSLGRLVGEKRDGRLDPSYRKGIKLRIRVNRSKGRSLDLLDVATLFNAAAQYVEYRVLSWSVEVDNEPDALYLIRLLKQAKAVTSYGVLHGTSSPDIGGMRWCHTGATPAADQKWWSAYAA